MCLNPLAGKQKKAADLTQRHFYPDRGRTVVLGFGNVRELLSPFYGRAQERLGSSPRRRCENKQPKFSVTIQTLALNTPVGGSAQLLRSGVHCYAAAHQN